MSAPSVGARSSAPARPPRLPRRAAGYLFAQTAVERLILFVIPVAIYLQTGSLSASGVAYIAEWLPTILALPVVGAVVDRHPGDVVLRVVNLVRALTCVFAAVAVLGGLGPAALISVGAVLGVANIFAYMVFEKYVFGLDPQVVTSAYSYFQSLQYVMLLAMPLLGSVALTGGRLTGLLLTCAAVYAVMLVPLIGRGMMTGSAADPADAADDPGWRELVQGAAHMARNPHARALVLLLFAVNLAYGTLYSALPALTGATTSSTALLPLGYGSAAVISLVYFFTVPRRNAPRLVARIGLVAAFSTVALPMLLWLSGSSRLAVLVFALSVGPMVAFSVWIRVLRNRLLDSRSFALQASVMMMGSTAAYPVAGAYLAVVGDRLSPHTAVSVLGLVCLAGVTGAALSLRSHLREPVGAQHA